MRLSKISLVTVILSGRIRFGSLHDNFDFRISAETCLSVVNHSRKMINIHDRKIGTTIHNNNIFLLNFHNKLLFLYRTNLLIFNNSSSSIASHKAGSTLGNIVRSRTRCKKKRRNSGNNRTYKRPKLFTCQQIL
uniref:Uncharacterized protein n=1 Tax=Microviridae sp. ctNWS1 TaxID=2826733 RepID=A0A8S5N3R4_9VIRU|nr:MAG TPA: hypothetical protein [Microviridae sp. ctNWS1]